MSQRSVARRDPQVIVGSIAKGRNPRGRMKVKTVKKRLMVSRVHQAPAFGFQDRVAEFAGGVQLELDGLLGTIQCRSLRVTVRLAAGELGDFR